jgi:hypothetical protein
MSWLSLWQQPLLQVKLAICQNICKNFVSDCMQRTAMLQSHLHYGVEKRVFVLMHTCFLEDRFLEDRFLEDRLCMSRFSISHNVAVHELFSCNLKRDLLFRFLLTWHLVLLVLRSYLQLDGGFELPGFLLASAVVMPEEAYAARSSGRVGGSSFRSAAPRAPSRCIPHPIHDCLVRLLMRLSNISVRNCVSMGARGLSYEPSNDGALLMAPLAH